MPTTRILVPLDGSPLAEGALSEAHTLARALDAEVMFLQVLPTVELIEAFGVTIPVDEQWEDRKARALEYLNAVRARPEWKDVKTESFVQMGSAAEGILDFCEKHDIDRIVMSTHGRSGVTRWVLGSVAEKVVRSFRRTVVLVRTAVAET